MLLCVELKPCRLHVVLLSRANCWICKRDVIALMKVVVGIKAPKHLQYDSAEWEPAFLRQAREFPFFPLLPREASKQVPIFDRGTEAKPWRLGKAQTQLHVA